MIGKGRLQRAFSIVAALICARKLIPKRKAHHGCAHAQKVAREHPKPALAVEGPAGRVRAEHTGRAGVS
ncbi:hypothetical protein B6F29_05560 [Mycobacterium tuberculosis variant bovis]|uniref:Uncharacterized protein n=1 Tax=Mycobacterium tuberculosis TaxID=1773 RepID=A0A654ZMF7_MYCTX|nr:MULTISPECIES: hypothetical protein [Mycobacterium]AQO28554.1 hypothetical protein L778_05295 [Mycobacterium tuberculosis TRS21]AQP10856.1 hypothetical protein L779_05310 [Mycobacterium tuberculosis TRS22]AQP18650.1 hypothetical protein L786_05230 [Mycobacterium tuberculosis TRS29]EFD12555.1 conserved hypothetical protein [Mycobacterium tuberculosis T46]EFD16713.1 conserved hypothetical protein [Mycobacterium tuberculosis CPHL_A]ESK76984.1 hypothetical protein O216_05430 [Mycobacterium tube